MTPTEKKQYKWLIDNQNKLTKAEVFWFTKYNTELALAEFHLSKLYGSIMERL